METPIKAGLYRGCPRLDIENDQNTCPNASSCVKLNVNDWLSDIPRASGKDDLVEVRFKNTRKDFFRVSGGLNLKTGDLVAVEASPGHDIGMVSLTGPLVYNQLDRNRLRSDDLEFKQVYRKAKPADIEKWREAIALEHETMIRSRKISEDLKLDMKIGDVEYQGDKTKAIFYYIADERVDFRELIKVLAENFRIRIEMRQIGARQEAGRIGGIGSCGRELCCSTWIRNFVSVTTTVARNQELSLNLQKLAGQCGKLKCCLNYEVETYMDVRRSLPSQEVELETREGKAYHQKTDIFKGIMWYSFSPDSTNNLVPVKVERVEEIIELNRKGIIAERLIESDDEVVEKELGYFNAVGQDSLTRFDGKKNVKPSGPKRKSRRKNQSRQ
jgi:cell fate regulator YaaT (PSP1 superfamily)